jgi:hypothetical protein
MAIYFDAADVDYLATHFSVPQLRRETLATICEEWADDFRKACRLAIEIIKSYEPKQVPVPGKQYENAESIKARYDIVDYINQYTRLRKSGNRLTGLCPFHSEKNPSFFVFPNEQRWHCFGACNTGGSIIDFVMKLDNITLKEALIKLSS